MSNNTNTTRDQKTVNFKDDMPLLEEIVQEYEIDKTYQQIKKNIAEANDLIQQFDALWDKIRKK